MKSVDITDGVVTTHNMAPRRIAPSYVKASTPLRWTDPQSIGNSARHIGNGVRNFQTQKPLPDPKIMAENLARALVEVRVGMRSLAGLKRFLKPNLYGLLENRGNTHLKTNIAPGYVHVRSNRISHISPFIVEATTLVEVAGRIRAVALRIEALRGRWVVTALEMP